MPNPLMKNVKQVLLDEETLAARIRELGRQITEDYQGKDLLVLCVLKGSMFFVSDLIKVIDLPLVVDFIAVSSYGDALQTSGVVRIT